MAFGIDIYNPFQRTESQIRMAGKNIETATYKAEFEAFYGGQWRDISSDFRAEVTKSGNKIVRAIRWDDGFRTYRQDRDLIIRRKVRRDPEEPGGGDGPLTEFLQSFGTAFAAVTARSLLQEGLGLSSFQSFLGTSLLFDAPNLLDSDVPLINKALSVGESVATSVAFKFLPPQYKILGVTSYVFARSMLKGKTLPETVSSMAGGFLGVGAAKSINWSFAGGATKPPAVTVSKQGSFIEGLQPMAKQNQVRIENLRAIRSLGPGTPRPTLSSFDKYGKVKQRSFPSSIADEKSASLKFLAERLRTKGIF